MEEKKNGVGSGDKPTYAYVEKRRAYSQVDAVNGSRTALILNEGGFTYLSDGIEEISYKEFEEGIKNGVYIPVYGEYININEGGLGTSEPLGGIEWIPEFQTGPGESSI